MRTAAKHYPAMPTRILSISIILLCLLAVVMLLGWVPVPARSALAATAVAPAPAAMWVVAKGALFVKCAGCGVVTSARTIENLGNSGSASLVGGAVIGGVLGNQMGGDRGRDLLTVFGALGGAMAGNKIENPMQSRTRYESTVRFDNGSTRVFIQASPPQWQPGDRIKVIDGAIQLHG